MTKKSYQTKLDEGPIVVQEATARALGDILNSCPERSIRLQVRGRSHRAQLRFYHHEEKSIAWVQRALGLDLKPSKHKSQWLLTITRKAQVIEILNLLMPYLNTVAMDRAGNLIEALAIIDATQTKLQRMLFPPPELVELARLLY